MESLNLLKQEINQTLDSEHDFAKWKLIVVAALGGAALGLAKTDQPRAWLLLLIPFACAYIDLHLAQYQARILVLAQFIRRYRPSPHSEGADTTLADYEKYCHDLRATKDHFFDLGQFANRIASIGLSIAAPVVAAVAFWGWKSIADPDFWKWLFTGRHAFGLAIWLVGFAAILKIWSSHRKRLKKLKQGSFNITSRRIALMIQPLYTLEEIEQITSFLEQMGTLRFPALPNGLFPAAVSGQDKSYTGYSYIWVRDNIHIAHAHHVIGQTEVAVKNLSTLMQYFSRHQARFTDIISGKADPSDPMNRPHIRFDGSTLGEINQKWAHAQNDALGYFLWMFCRLVNEGRLAPSPDDLGTLDLFAPYFNKIRYWQDEDSGHWEEERKISASSIGTVIAGLNEFEKLLLSGKTAHPNAQSTPELVKSLISNGRAALDSILPAECVQPNRGQKRKYDAALLFLIYPLRVVESAMAERILENVREHLQGEYGIRRYLGDSYWAPDYKKKLAPGERTVDFSDNLASRDQLLPGAGKEAQWSLFDPIISCIYGARFQGNVRGAYLGCQTEYLNRSLGQLTSETSQEALPFRCTELYYLEDEHYVPNDHVPLLWTQANLMLSLWFMKESCKRAAQS